MCKNDGTACSRCHCEEDVELSEKALKEMLDASTLDKISSQLAMDMLFHWIHQMNPAHVNYDPVAREKIVLMCRGALAAPGWHWVEAQFTTELVTAVYDKLWAMWKYLGATWATPVKEKDKDPATLFRFDNFLGRNAVCIERRGNYPHCIKGLQVKVSETEEGRKIEGQLLVFRDYDKKDEWPKCQGPFDLTVSAYDPQIEKNRSFKILGVEVQGLDDDATVSFIAHGVVPWRIDA